MNLKLVMIPIATLAMLMVGCKSSADTATVDSQIAAPPISGMRPAKAVAKVHIYKTNGDYDNYVPVSLDASRKQIMSFPAPSDLAIFLTVEGWERTQLLPDIHIRNIWLCRRSLLRASC